MKMDNLKVTSKKELEFILQEGEGLKIEFKKSANWIDKEIVAFANSDGGRIFLGVDDKNVVKGIKITNKLKSQVQNVARSCDPSVKIELEEFCTQGVPSNNLNIKSEGRNVLIVNVEEGKDKPYKCSSGFYLRQGANSQKMSRDEILDFATGEGKVRFDEQVNEDFDFKKDFDEGKLERYLDLAKISKIISNEKIFEELNIVKKDKTLRFNNAGVLFFAKEPQRFISHSVFTVVLFKDRGGADVIDRKEITGGLFEIVDRVMDFVKLYAKVAYKFTGKPQRENIYEYPFEAIREAVINSVMHKNYFEHGHNNILKFFPDRIQIENIWIKPKSFVLGETVYRRNKIVADLFSRIHFGERIGSGVERMKVYCRKEDAPFPKIDFNGTYFYIVFKPSKVYLERAGGVEGGSVENQKKELELSQVDEWLTRVNVKLTQELSDNEKKVLFFMIRNGKINSTDLQDLLRISRVMANRYFNRLIDNKLIERKGVGKSTYYVMSFAKEIKNG